MVEDGDAGPAMELDVIGAPGMLSRSFGCLSGGRLGRETESERMGGRPCEWPGLLMSVVDILVGWVEATVRFVLEPWN